MKQTVKLNESQLRQIVAECVKKVLRETEEFNASIPEDEMQEGYLTDLIQGGFYAGRGANDEDWPTKGGWKRFVNTGDVDGYGEPTVDDFSKSYDEYKRDKEADKLSKTDKSRERRIGSALDAAMVQPGKGGKATRTLTKFAAKAGKGVSDVGRAIDDFKYNKLGLAKPYKK